MPASEILKACTRCHEDKPLDGFSRDSSRSDGRHLWCKKCRKEQWAERRAENLEEARRYDRERMREWAHKNPEKKRANDKRSGLRSRYGLEEAEYAALTAVGCAICGTDEGLVIDHDHKTGKVRAALCGHCNRGLGCFRDRPDLLMDARRYLESHGA